LLDEEAEDDAIDACARHTPEHEDFIVFKSQWLRAPVNSIRELAGELSVTQRYIHLSPSAPGSLIARAAGRLRGNIMGFGSKGLPFGIDAITMSGLQP